MQRCAVSNEGGDCQAERYLNILISIDEFLSFVFFQDASPRKEDCYTHAWYVSSLVTPFFILIFCTSGCSLLVLHLLVTISCSTSHVRLHHTLWEVVKDINVCPAYIVCVLRYVYLRFYLSNTVLKASSTTLTRLSTLYSTL